MVPIGRVSRNSREMTQHFELGYMVISTKPGYNELKPMLHLYVTFDHY